MLGLTGTPMAIGAVAVFGSSFMNYVLFKQLNLGENKDTLAFAIELKEIYFSYETTCKFLLQLNRSICYNSYEKVIIGMGINCKLISGVAVT